MQMPSFWHRHLQVLIQIYWRFALALPRLTTRFRSQTQKSLFEKEHANATLLLELVAVAIIIIIFFVLALWFRVHNFCCVLCASVLRFVCRFWFHSDHFEFPSTLGWKKVVLDTWEVLVKFVSNWTSTTHDDDDNVLLLFSLLNDRRFQQHKNGCKTKRRW